MKLLIRKRTGLFFLFFTIASTVHGRGRSKSCSDMSSLQQPQQLQSLQGDIDVITIDRDGSIRWSRILDSQFECIEIKNINDFDLVKNRLKNFPPNVQRDLGEHFLQRLKQGNGKYRCIMAFPKEFRQEYFLVWAVKAVFNNPMVIKILNKAIPPMLIKILPRYSLEHKRKKEIDRELMLQQKRKEEALKELKRKKDKLKKSSDYFKQIILLQSYQQKKSI